MLTAEQKKERLLGIGGSEVGYIAGYSRYKTPLDIYLIKIGEKEEEDIDSEAIEIGNDLEQYAAEVYARRKGVDIEKPNKSIVHPEYPWMRCNLDFVVKGRNIILECKTTGFLGDEWGEEGSDNMPIPYLLQCAHNAIVSDHIYNTKQVDVPVFSGGRGGLKHRVYTYNRNPELEKNLINLERKFWKENVEKRVPPEPSSMKELIALCPPSENIVKVATEEEMSMINSFKNLKKQIDELEKLYEQQKLDICKHMAGASFLLDDMGHKIASWKEQTRNTLDTQSFKDKYPNIYTNLLKETKSHVLRVT
jgi:putative phage-type endonuclease